jgi:hypothetical protein
MSSPSGYSVESDRCAGPIMNMLVLTFERVRDKGKEKQESSSSFSSIDPKKCEERFMTRNQEIWNAITMLFTPLFGLYFIFSGNWITEENLVKVNESLLGNKPDFLVGVEDKCISSAYFPNLHALPPWTTISVVIGFMLHSPCSIYFHLMCAFKLHTWQERLNHWSRRLDQAMIHIMGVFIVFGMSGNIRLGVIQLLFSIDSSYRLFQPGFRPRSNQIRILISIILTTLPAIMYEHYEDFTYLIVINLISTWIFVAYPFGGYSHGIFHLVIAMTNPIQLKLSTKVLSSQNAINIGATCANMLSKVK